jgi:hypothetical protein
MAAELESNTALKQLRDFAPEAVEEARTFRGEVTVYIKPAEFRRACEFLRDEPGLKYSFLADVTALDLYPQEPRFEVVYHLLSETSRDLSRQCGFGPPPMRSSVRSSICLGSCLRVTPTFAACCCRTNGKVTRCAKTIPRKVIAKCR